MSVFRNILVILTFFLFINASHFIQENGKEKIVWNSENELEWGMFQGGIPFGANHSASSSCNMYMNWKVDDKYNLLVECYAYFRPEKSWKKGAFISDDLLLHEQKHFDIAEIHTRTIKKEVSNIIFTSISNANVQIKTIYDNQEKKLKQMQNQYDIETNHSKNKEEQIKWNTKVDSILLSLDAYSKKSLKLNISYLYR